MFVYSDGACGADGTCAILLVTLGRQSTCRCSLQEMSLGHLTHLSITVQAGV